MRAKLALFLNKLKTLFFFSPVTTDWTAKMECFGCAKTFEKRLKICERCRSAFYCCVDCQKTDWRRHRANCKVYNDGIVPAKQNEVAEMRRVMNSTIDGYFHAILVSRVNARRKDQATKMLKDLQNMWNSKEVLETSFLRKNNTVVIPGEILFIFYTTFMNVCKRINDKKKLKLLIENHATLQPV